METDKVVRRQTVILKLMRGGRRQLTGKQRPLANRPRDGPPPGRERNKQATPFLLEAFNCGEWWNGPLGGSTNAIIVGHHMAMGPWLETNTIGVVLAFSTTSVFTLFLTGCATIKVDDAMTFPAHQKGVITEGSKLTVETRRR